MTRAPNKIGVSDDLAVGVDGDGGGASPAAVWLGFNVGASGMAGEMMSSIYRSLIALHKPALINASLLSSFIKRNEGMGLFHAP
jgi:hypothetical protein